MEDQNVIYYRGIANVLDDSYSYHNLNMNQGASNIIREPDDRPYEYKNPNEALVETWRNERLDYLNKHSNLQGIKSTHEMFAGEGIFSLRNPAASLGRTREVLFSNSDIIDRNFHYTPSNDRIPNSSDDRNNNLLDEGSSVEKDKKKIRIHNYTYTALGVVGMGIAFTIGQTVYTYYFRE